MSGEDVGQEGAQLCERGRRAGRVGYHAGADGLAEHGIGRTHDGGVGHARVETDRGLDLGGGDVEPAPVDQFLEPPEDVDAPVGVDAAQVARAVPAVGRRVGVLPVADRRGGAEGQLADLAGGEDRAPARLEDGDRPVRRRPLGPLEDHPPHRPSADLLAIGGEHGEVLAAAVHVEEVDAEILVDAVDQRPRQGRGGGDGPAEGVDPVLPRVEGVEEQGEVGRHAGQHGDPLLGHQLQGTGRGEPLGDHQPAPAQEGPQGQSHAEDAGRRQMDHVDVLRAACGSVGEELHLGRASSKRLTDSRRARGAP